MGDSVENAAVIPVPGADSSIRREADVRNDSADQIGSIARKIACLLRTLNTPTSLFGVEPEIFERLRTVHEFPPSVSKRMWDTLGDALKVCERPTVASISGEFWVSLRCDGTGFSKWTKRMRRKGILKDGYSEDFATMMQSCCRVLMEKFGGKAGFTQSDEMTILIPPASVVRGEQQPHRYNGRVAKLTSLAAAMVTAHFNHELHLLCARLGGELTVNDLVTFDCRVGTYQTKEEAMSLLLWRAYDCNVNAVSDAVYRCKGRVDGAGQAMRLPTGLKLQWLEQNAPPGTLPLPRHQRQGSYYWNRRVKATGTNPKTGETVECLLRSRTESIEGNLLLLFREEKMFPDDDAPLP